VDYKLWIISLKIHKLGKFYLAEGRSLVVAFSRSMNTQRYITNTAGSSIAPIQSDINNLFSKTPPFDINNGLNHFE